MKLTKTTALHAMVATLLLAPAASFAGMRTPCTSSEVTPESYTWNFRREAMDLMRDIHAKSTDVRTEADKLAASQPLDLSWQFRAGELSMIKDDVNAMGQDLCRLQAIRSTVPAWEQRVIDQAAPDLQLMAIHTQDAIEYLNQNRLGLWRPVYRKFETTLQTEAQNLTQLTGDSVQFSKLNARERRLQKQVGVKAAS